MKDVLYEKKGKIAYITLNRPEKLNSITVNMVNEMGEIWKNFLEDDECLVSILSGAGRAFCAGVAINEMEPGKMSLSGSPTVGDETIGPMRRKVWKPIIAALHSYVFGGGFWLALECDLRIAATNTIFSLPEPKIGIPTPFAAFLSNFMPRGIAAELLLVGGRMDAQRAYQVGIVNKVVPPDVLMEESTALAEHICQVAPLAVQAMKKVMIRSMNLDYQSALNLTEDIFLPVFESEDLKEGKKAFKEKRDPEWKCK